MTSGVHAAAVHDPALPALGLLADPAALGALLERAPWLRRPRVDEAAVRLRWKPGTNVRAGLVVPTADGPAAVLLAEFAAGSGKANGLMRRLRGVRVLRHGDLVVAPAAADPALRPRVPPGLVPLGYNPARRIVGRAGDEVVKVHAAPVRPGVRTLATAVAGARWPERRVSRTPWMPGRAPGPGELTAVTAAVHALHRTPPPPGLPVLTAEGTLQAARRAASAVGDVLPDRADRLRRVLHLLTAAAGRGWPEPDVVVHGDLSPDQVVLREDGTAVLIDLDRACLGPAGWDGAVWAAAELAAGSPDPLPPPVAAPAVLRAAALLLRAPEPFRRLRPGWAPRTEALLAAAERALEET